MDTPKSRFENWLRLMLAMTDGNPHTARELADEMGTSTRNFYYVLRTLRELGFKVVHAGTSYYLDPSSPFFQRMTRQMSLTADDAAYLLSLLGEQADSSPRAGMLYRKLVRYYHLDTADAIRQRQRVFDNTAQIERAIQSRRVAILHGYSSPHSHSVSDRVVEPFLFQGDREDVRAFEIKTKQNKTFKLARIGSVEVVDTPWFHEDRHRQVFTDMFMFSGEERHHVVLMLSQLAYHLMTEEYPHSDAFMTRMDDGRWRLETDVVSYVGMARFILGLYEEIEIVEDEGLRAFVHQRILRAASLSRLT